MIARIHIPSPAANLRDANLRDVVADKFTRWPDGFDPAAAGVVVR